jgi:hypothetical protein
VGLDRVDGDRQPRGDLLVRETRRRELDDALLRGRELADRAAPARADARELRPREVGPARRVERVERVDGALERRPRDAPAAGAALRASEGEQRARGVDVQPALAVVAARAREGRNVGLVIACRETDQRLAPRGSRHGPWMLLPVAELAQPCGNGSRLVRVAELDARLDEIGLDRECARLVDALASRVLPDGAQPLPRLRRLARDERGDAERAQRLEDLASGTRAPRPPRAPAGPSHAPRRRARDPLRAARGSVGRWGR